MAKLYCQGLGLQTLGGFHDHEGFDGVILGMPGAAWHFEFTYAGRHPVKPTPTAEDLVVLYLPDEQGWRAACQRAEAAGFTPVASFNPYWEQRGRTFDDPDGYRVVLQNAAWHNGTGAG